VRSTIASHRRKPEHPGGRQHVDHLGPRTRRGAW
jgi:hypothetical protein